MSASVRLAFNLIAEPELLRSRDGKPVAGYGVAIGRRIEIQAPELVAGGLTGRRGTTDSTVNHFDHSTERVVSGGNHFGEVGVSLKASGAHLGRQTALAVTTEI